MKTLAAFALLLVACASVPVHAPSKLETTTADSGGVNVKWQLPQLQPTKLWLEKSTDMAPFKQIAELEGSATSYVDPDGSTGARYRVLAFDDDPLGGTYSKEIVVK